MELVLFRAYWTFVPWPIGLKVLSLGRHEIFSPEDDEDEDEDEDEDDDDDDDDVDMRMGRHLKLANTEGHEDPFAN